ncbi:hypothetical protein ACFV6Z_15030 [Streptomyces sp. NPDC059818]|uniref:hypothetical protein n=1 Tax=Streptomyces sp. NPDC059818 TaxID=3346962 RepID=UPI00365BEF82
MRRKMFHFQFEGPSGGVSGRGSEGGLEDNDDYQYLVIEGCSSLSETDCRFAIGGFGQDDWKFDIEYDMSSFLEGLPELLAALESGRVVAIDLYPQGVERVLTFTPQGDVVSVECTSRTSWTPDPRMECHDLAELLRMARKLATDFSKAVSAAAPEIGRLEPFTSWKAGQFH